MTRTTGRLGGRTSFAAAALTPVLLAVLAAVGAAPSAPPAPREVDELVDAWWEADARSEAGLDERRRILARLDEITGPLGSREIATWTKTLTKRWEKGPRLDKGSGRQFWWEQEERGLFFVGGETKRPKGLFLGMHGGGWGSGDASTSHSAWSAAADKYGWVGLFPQVLEQTELGWTDSGTEEFVMELVEAARRTWKLDADHVFFGGHSMGGYGSWTLGSHHADTVAALTPAAGAPSPYLGPDGKAVDIVPGVIPSLRNVPMVIYQSRDDPRVPPDANQVAVKRLGEARQRWGGFDFEYWEVDGMGHDYPPGGTRALLEKVHERVRDPRPERVVWQPELAWKQQFYWLFWDRPARHALVVADLDASANGIAITCDQDAHGLWVLLDDELLDVEREVVVTLNGQETWRGLPEARLSTLLITGTRGDPGLTFPYRVPVWP